MGIDSRHPHYTGAQNQWSRIRDSFNGSDSIKAGGESYLPKLSGQSDDDYDSYKLRAVYYNGIERTVRGLIGAVMRVDPIIEVPKKIEPLLNDITNTGISLNDFISYMLSEQLLMGRQGVLVDRNEERPYLTGYCTEQITNWLGDRIILEESYRKINKDDPYQSEYDIQYRELVKEGESYIVYVWQKTDKEWQIVEEIVPTNKGVPLTEIPFIGVSGDGLNLDPGASPMTALADIGLSMYRTSADLEHGRHFTALPTPYVTGIDADSELSIGSGSAWVLPDTNSKAGYLEFSGQGLQALEKAMEEKRSMMASSGAQLLQSQKNGVESADSVRLRQNAEASTLIGIVKTVERAINRALTTMAEWDGASEEIKVALNTDFIDTKITSQDMQSLMQAWQSGGISHETFLWNMKRGEILHPEMDIETERDRIEVQTVGSE